MLPTSSFKLKTALYLVLCLSYFSFAQDNITLTFCDDNNDGFLTFNTDELKDFGIQGIGGLDDALKEQILVSSAYGVFAINTPSTSPTIETICEEFLAFDIAVDINKTIYLTSTFRIEDDCNYTYVEGLFDTANALSFDDLNNLYVGYSDSPSVGRYSALEETAIGIGFSWHNFEEGTAGGDFVLFNEKMYVSWRLSSTNYRLYEVTVDADRNYISHIDLGQLPNKSYGLAQEYGKIYGITPTKLYQINLEDFTFTDIIENPNPEIEWYGAAGLHEAITFNISMHTSFEDAEANTNALLGEWTNTIPGGQVVYIRIQNTLTGTIDITTITLVIYEHPSVNIPVDLEKCSFGILNNFDLNEVSQQMLTDSDQNLEFVYYDANPLEFEIVNLVPLNYQTSSDVQFLYVEVINLDGGCSDVYEFRLINYDLPEVAPLSTQQMPRNLTTCYLDSAISGYFDLSEMENEIILQNGDFETAYYLSFNDAESGENEIPSIYYLEASNEEVFIKVTNENGCYSISNFFIDFNCIRNNPSTDFIVFPKFITPNNDTKNDFWNVKGISERLRNESLISIFNRYGKRLISFRPSSIPGWDGTVNGTPLPTDDYWVIFKTNSGFTKTGHFTLKR